MTGHNSENASSATTTEPITDHESLRDREDVPFHEDTDVVDPEVVDRVAALDDLAGVGITNRDGDLLFRRLTDTCAWKIPVASVGPEEDFAAAIREQISETIGFTVELDAIEGVWEFTVETADGERTASRAFVIFRGSLASGSDDLEAATPEDEPVEDAGWFDDLPEGADEIPGTGLFLD